MIYFFLVKLNTVAGDNPKNIIILPPSSEGDENGIPVYDEDFLLCCNEYKDYIKATKAAVVDVQYSICSAPDNVKLHYDNLLNGAENGVFTVIDSNSYLIEVKKAKPKKSSSSKKTPVALYVVIAVVIIGVLVMLAYNSSKNKNETAEETSDSVSENSSVSEISDSPAATSDTPVSNIETTEPVSSVPEATTSITTVPAEATVDKITLTFDKNGGVGALTASEYEAGSVVELPFTGVSKVGYTLTGWATADAEPYTLYDNELNLFTMPSEPITLYAVWTATEYEVTYHYVINGNAATSKERTKYGEVIQLMDAALIPAGDGNGSFIGWGLTPNDTEPVKSVTMPDGGIDLYAIYN